MVATRVLGVRDLSALVEVVGLTPLLDELIERLRDALGGHDPDLIDTFDRCGFQYDKPDLGLIEWMPAREVGRRAAIKTVGYHPTNPAQRGVPSVLATTSLYDTLDGSLLTLCEATFLTALRTGAASAVATDVLAVPDAAVLGVVGCGAQAVTQIHAISRVRPIERVLAVDTRTEVAETLGARLDGVVDVAVDVVDPAEVTRLVAESDVLCTCTSVDIGAGPVVPFGPHHPWLHVNAVGADFAGKVELPRELLDAALVVPDVRSQCVLEGECQRLEPHQIGPDLTEVVGAPARWSAHRPQLTVFDSTGWALEDLVAAELVLDLAERHDLGVEMELQWDGDDPHDPYGALR